MQRLRVLHWIKYLKNYWSLLSNITISPLHFDYWQSQEAKPFPDSRKDEKLWCHNFLAELLGRCICSKEKKHCKTAHMSMYVFVCLCVHVWHTRLTFPQAAWRHSGVSRRFQFGWVWLRLRLGPRDDLCSEPDRIFRRKKLKQWSSEIMNG